MDLTEQNWVGPGSGPVTQTDPIGQPSPLPAALSSHGRKSVSRPLKRPHFPLGIWPQVQEAKSSASVFTAKSSRTAALQAEAPFASATINSVVATRTFCYRSAFQVASRRAASANRQRSHKNKKKEKRKGLVFHNPHQSGGGRRGLNRWTGL